MGRKKKNSKNEKEGAEDEIRPKINIGGDTKRSIASIFLFTLSLLILLSFINKAGVVGEFLNELTGTLMGWTKYFLPIFLTAAGIFLLLRKEVYFYVSKIVGMSLALISLAGFFHSFFDVGKMKEIAATGSGGGYIGFAIAYGAIRYLERAGGLVVIVSLFLIGIIVSFNFPIISLFHKWKEIREKKKEEASSEEYLPSESEEDADGEIMPGADDFPNDKNNKEIANEQDKGDENIENIQFIDGPDRFVDSKLLDKLSDDIDSVKKQEISKTPKGSGRNNFKYGNTGWKFPPLELLDEDGSDANPGDIERNVAIIVKKLQDFGIGVTPGETSTGPTVTQYTFRPAVGIKISRILSLQDDLALALAARSIRIEAPIPGKSYFGVEVPNKEKALVRLRDIFESKEFDLQKRKSSLTIPLGKDVNGDRIFADLGKMPHLLVAGATNTGKSICLNSIIVSLLYQNSPKKMKIIMVDPKRVELSRYQGIPHLTTNVITESSKAVNVLKWAVGEMERRFRQLQDISVVNIESYNLKVKNGEKRKYTDPETGKVFEENIDFMPYIVIIIDEVAELMVSHGKEVEGAIVRLTQMARAVGIHLIVSTQRPEVKIITGLIKANIINRIALKVATQVDSRTIIDMAGSEKLLGSGDMLFLSPNSTKPRRIQGVFAGEAEVERVVRFILDQKKEYEDETGDEMSPILQEVTSIEYKTEESDGEESAVYEAAKEEVIRAGKASATLLQRRLKIGYPKAARILDMLEEKGVIGPADGAKPREVFASPPHLSQPDYENPPEDQQKRDKWQI